MAEELNATPTIGGGRIYQRKEGGPWQFCLWVIQADLLTQADLPTVLVVPLTTQMRRGADLLRVSIRARDRLLRDCYAMAEQPRALDRARLGEGPLTTLTSEELIKLEQALRLVMGLTS
jgi:mRNA interferase MazF